MRRRPSKVAANYTGPDFSCYPGEHIKQDPGNYLAGTILGLPLDGTYPRHLSRSAPKSDKNSRPDAESSVRSSMESDRSVVFIRDDDDVYSMSGW